MFRALLALCIVAAVAAFGPARLSTRRSTVTMSMQKNLAAAALAASLFASPAFAVEGAAPKQSFFGASPASSPFAVGEDREDPIYSPYSPYGDGSKAVYNARAGGADELKFWKEKLAESERRVARVPAYADKKTWSEITTELTRYTYSMRESMLRLAGSDKVAIKAAREYFTDLNDMFEWAVKKDTTKVQAAYTKSLKDMEAFKALAAK